MSEHDAVPPIEPARPPGSRPEGLDQPAGETHDSEAEIRVAQAEALLEDSEIRSQDRSAAPGTVVEHRRSEDTVEPVD